MIIILVGAGTDKNYHNDVDINTIDNSDDDNNDMITMTMRKIRIIMIRIIMIHDDTDVHDDEIWL